MNTNIVIIGLLAVIIGFGAGFTARGTQMPMGGSHMMSGGSIMDNDDMGRGMGTAMDSMMMSLEGKTGDAFDRAFLSGMIMHHEGAVEMAEAALKNAKHQEIKDMAADIIVAQTAEINQMRTWAKTWYNQ